MELTNVELGGICAIEATNRQALIDVIDGIIGDWEFSLKSPKVSYLHITMEGRQSGCMGGSVDYKTEADIPEYSIPCPCGNPKHWLIKYEENESGV